MLFALKWLYPNRVWLSRGNHETSDMCVDRPAAHLTAQEQSLRLRGRDQEKVQRAHVLALRVRRPSARRADGRREVFCALPIGHLITASQPPTKRKDPRLPLKPQLGPNGTIRYLVLHGGLFSSDDIGLEDIRKIDRIRQKQPSGDTIMGEALWCDPQVANGRGPSKVD